MIPSPLKPTSQSGVSHWRDHCPADEGRTFQQNVDKILTAGCTVALRSERQVSAKIYNVVSVAAIEGVGLTIEEAIENALMNPLPT